MKKRPDYKGFVLHLREWKKFGIPYSIGDLIQLAKKYNTPIPKEFKERII